MSKKIVIFHPLATALRPVRSFSSAAAAKLGHSSQRVRERKEGRKEGRGRGRDGSHAAGKVDTKRELDVLSAEITLPDLEQLPFYLGIILLIFQRFFLSLLNRCIKPTT